ncbi:unnamed protein product [Ceutorhynchus assimilis]|uniref:RHD domain-containing protein n=1 Tax=Ceutorhynchus assimilis TaxID=467358 RepID=A0A9N9QJB7_9CUCU|nr:unnamed protein product [Ceutorhynchus assimilis]
MATRKVLPSTSCASPQPSTSTSRILPSGSCDPPQPSSSGARNFNAPGTSSMNDAPFLRFIEQPANKYRFRYKSEMLGTRDCLKGITSDRLGRPTYPTVELVNYSGSAMIRFGGMGIIHTPRRNVVVELSKKMLVLKKELIARCEGMRRELTANEIEEIRVLAVRKSRDINLNAVCLRFDAFFVRNGILYSICPPIFSHGIINLRSPLTGDLKIVRMNRCVSHAEGGEEIFLLVERLTSPNIRIRLFELDADNREVWEAYGTFSELDIHHHYAIVFRTPAFRDQNITHPVMVLIELVRPSDFARSDVRNFWYIPNIHGTGQRIQPSPIIEMPLEDITRAQQSFFELRNLASQSRVRAGLMLKDHFRQYEQQTRQNNMLHVFIALNKKPEVKFILNMLQSSKQLQLANVVNADNLTPLHLAVMCHNEDFVRYLRTLHADPTIQNSRGRTPLHEAAKSAATPKMFELLLSFENTMIDIVDYAGFTALTLAIETTNMTAIRALANAGADVNRRHDRNGHTPLRIAVEHEFVEAVRYFLDHPRLFLLLLKILQFLL